MGWLRQVFSRRRRCEELSESIREHIDEKIADLMDRGLPREEAIYVARREFGNATLVEERSREVWQLPVIENLSRNLRYASRVLFKNPGYTVTILLTLALGIGANTAIFTVNYATLLAPLPYSHPQQLVVIWSREHQWITAGDFLDWKRSSTAFQQLNAWTPEAGDSFNLATTTQPESIRAISVTPGYYQMLGEQFFLGRGFLAEEGQAGRDHVAILTHRLWKRLGSNEKIIGQDLHLNGMPYTVVGVLEPGLADRRTEQLIVPLVFPPDQLNHSSHWLLATGRLKPGVTIQQAQAELNAITTHAGQINSESKLSWGAVVEPLKDNSLPRDRKLTLWLLMGAVGFVLLIACVNVTNLVLAKGMSRQKEIAVRSSLGASSRAIFFQFLTESTLLAIPGGLLGVGVGYLMLRGLVTVMPPNTLPAEANLHLSLPILLFTLAATTAAGLIFGFVPAWYASHFDPAEGLKEGGRSGIGVRSQRLRRSLVVGEFALALALLTGAGLTIHSFWNLMRVDLGIQTDHVLSFHLQVPDSRFHKPEQIVAYYRQLLTGVESVSGVSHAAATVGSPLEWPGMGMLFTIAGKTAPADPLQGTGSAFDMVTPGYFRTFGVRTLRGRAFTEQDNASSAKVAMVNEHFLQRFLNGIDPFKQRLVVNEAIPDSNNLRPVEWQIVGVFQDVRIGEYHRMEPEVLLPFAQSPRSSATIGVRTAADPASMIKTIAAAVHQVDPQVALAAPRTLDQVREDELANDRFTMILFASFAIIALALASLGIYGVMSFSVAQRSQEIAIRMALGASQSRVVRLVVKEGALLGCIGFGIGLAGAFFVARAMQGILFGVGTIDMSVFGAVGLVLITVALMACFIPARRAALIDPSQALRSE
ncbi:MAG: ABC transporter permease [Acidobacteriaceae bacterium]